MSGVYRQPLYYDIAFSFRDVPAEVDVLEACIQRHGRIPVRRFLEIGCGNSPHLLELHRRGYSYVGIDLSEPMLEFSRSKLEGTGADVELLRADMTDFDLERPVEFAFLMLGSLFLANTEQLHSHFASVGRCVSSGGLYLLDWCVQFDSPFESEGESWTLERDGVVVTVEHRPVILDRIAQTFEERLVMRVNDKGAEHVFEDASVRRLIHPQEFLQFLAVQNDFEFIGWWNDWDLAQPLTGREKPMRPIALLRRK